MNYSNNNAYNGRMDVDDMSESLLFLSRSTSLSSSQESSLSSLQELSRQSLPEVLLFTGAILGESALNKTCWTVISF